MASTANNLIMMGKAYALSCDALDLLGDPIHHLAMNLLAANSVELSLKAWIVAKGGTEKEIVGLSHDLDATFRRATELGLEDPSGQIGWAIATINPMHVKAGNRYFPNIDGFTGLTPPSLAKLCRAVATAVEPVAWKDDEN